MPIQTQGRRVYAGALAQLSEAELQQYDAREATCPLPQMASANQVRAWLRGDSPAPSGSSREQQRAMQFVQGPVVQGTTRTYSQAPPARDARDGLERVLKQLTMPATSLLSSRTETVAQFDARKFIQLLRHPDVKFTTLSQHAVPFDVAPDQVCFTVMFRASVPAEGIRVKREDDPATARTTAEPLHYRDVGYGSGGEAPYTYCRLTMPRALEGTFAAGLAALGGDGLRIIVSPPEVLQDTNQSAWLML